MKLSVLSFLAFAGLSAFGVAATEQETKTNLRRNLRDGDGGDGDRDGGGDRNPPPPPVEGDLNIRFNKIPLSENAPDMSRYLPMAPEDYPVRGETAEALKRFTQAASIVTADDVELDSTRVSEYIKKIGGLPSMPNNKPDHEFWDEFRHVLKVQLDRRQSLPRDPNAIGVRFPEAWNGYTIHDVAEAVHDEYPGYHQAKLLEKLWADQVQLDTNIVHFRSNLDFIGLQVRFADLNTWAVGMVAPRNFQLKWHAGRPRPEEVAWLIATRELGVADGVPEDIVRDVMSMGLTKAADFTAYPEGSPVHPSWPAMHSAASSVSMWLAVLIDNITFDHLCEALRVDYGVSYARTVAGVHYPTDNIAGLNLGMKMMMDNLPDHMAKYYGSDPELVRAKLRNFVFDWNTFDSNDCSFVRGSF